jgi:broad specificity phosphatase PhoE
MARIAIAAASSHAFALMEPEDRFRQWNRRLYARRYGQEPPENPKVFQESDQDIRQRYESVRQGLNLVRGALERVDRVRNCR